MRSFIIKENDSGQRLDKFLAKCVPSLPFSAIYKGIRTKRIKVNEKRTTADYRLVCGDEVILYLNDSFFADNIEETSSVAFLQITPDINVVYEDENILIVNKKQGQICHSDDKEGYNTLISHIKAYLYQKGEYNPQSEQSFAPALCNRIDRNTGGLVIAAKNAESLRIMNEIIKNREISKRYMCIAIGKFEKESDTLISFIRKTGDDLVTVFEKPVPDGRKAIMNYRVLRTENRLNILDVELLTGRTHQIRAQLSFFGHPLLGDGKYGINSVNKSYGFKKQVLYSYSVTFNFENEYGTLGYLSGKTFSIREEVEKVLNNIMKSAR